MALENKFGIKNSAELARKEERISKKKAVELFENGMLENLEAGKFQTLCEIHKYLFDDIYDFAGKTDFTKKMKMTVAHGRYRL